MGKILAELQRHPTLLYTQAVQNLCKPLEHIDITNFSHVRVYNDQRLTVLCKGVTGIARPIPIDS